MLSPYPAMIDFWLTPWSVPFRSTCRWFTLETQPLRGRAQPDKEAPRWLRPLCLQRWVAQAIAARLVWLKDHPQARRYRYGRESKPCWDAVAWARYEWRILREFSKEMLLSIFGMEVERLLRITEEHPSLAGQTEWTCAVLGASEHITQLYAELKRRQTSRGGQSKALQARALLRAALNAYVCWECPGETL